MSSPNRCHSGFAYLALAITGMVVLEACNEPSASETLNPPGKLQFSIAPNEPSGFVTLTDWPMDSLIGGGWNCSGFQGGECSTTLPAGANIVDDPSDPGSAPKVLQWSGSPRGHLSFGAAVYRREEYSAFWWKGDGQTSALLWRDNQEEAMTFGACQHLGQSVPCVVFSQAAASFQNLQNNDCHYNIGEGWWQCGLYGNGKAVLTPGVWHRIELYLRASEAHDGIIRWWIDGVQGADYSGVDLRTVYVTSRYRLGNGGSFDDIRISVPEGIPAPARVDLQLRTVTSSSVRVSFEPADDGTQHAPRYEMRYAATPIGSGWGSASPVTQGSCKTMSPAYSASWRGCTIEGLTPGISYDFQIVAYRENADGSLVYGPLSPVITAVTTTTPPGSPAAIRDLGFVDYGPSEIILRYSHVDDGEGQPANYEIRYAPTPIGTGWGAATPVSHGYCQTPPRGSVGFIGTCTVDGLLPGTSYDFQIVAFRGALNAGAVFGELSNVATKTTSASLPPLPNTVGNLRASGVDTNNIALSFTEVDDGTGRPALYQVRYARTPIGSGENATPVSKGSCQFVSSISIGTNRICSVGGLNPNTSYDFQVVTYRYGVFGRRFGDLSNVATASTGPKPDWHFRGRIPANGLQPQ